MALKQGGVIEFSIPTFGRLPLPSFSLAQRNRTDVIAIVALTVFASVLRLVNLTTLPHGFHGDEAWTGLDALRVLHHGWIGPYVVSALGQPTGPLYFAAPFVGVFGRTMFAVRFPMALLGIATVPAFYVAVRVMYSRTLAVFAALLLSVSVWHLHFSRIGFMVISWPLMEACALLFLFLGLRASQQIAVHRALAIIAALLVFVSVMNYQVPGISWPLIEICTLVALFLAVRSNQLRLFAAAGVFLGLGVYTYNAYPIVFLPVGVYLLWLLVRLPPAERPAFTVALIVLGIAAFVAAMPLVHYALKWRSPFFHWPLQINHDYLSHHKLVSLFETDEWKQDSFFERMRLLFDKSQQYFLAIFWRGRPDYADGAGTDAIVDHQLLVLVLLGFVITLWRWRDRANPLVILGVLLVPFGAIVNVTGGSYRQSFGIVLFLSILAAVPLALWWQAAAEFGPRLRRASYGAIILVLGLVGYTSLHYYYAEFPDKPAARYTFAYEITDASLYIRDLPGNPYVYFYSARWGYNYETRRFLASNRKGEDRSTEFTEAHAFSLTPNHAGPLVYVFLDAYLPKANDIEAMFPGGVSHERMGPNKKMEYRAYYLPNGASGPGQPVTGQPTPGATPGQTPGATASPTVVGTPLVGGDVRDRQRQADLEKIRAALEQYRQKHNAYPSNDNGIQTLCIYKDLDAGCKLKEFLDPIPSDPFGNQGINGYFYISDGRTYTVYAIRESDVLAACPSHPPHLARFASLLCVSVP